MECGLEIQNFKVRSCYGWLCMKYMHVSYFGYHETCKYWVILCRNCKDYFILLQIPSNKLAFVKFPYLFICFFKTVSVTQMQ